MTTANLLVWGLILHALGDYVTQPHWVATEKTHRHGPAILHGVLYGLPFLILTRDPAALAVITLTHIVIDRYRLARHVIWLKNQAAPRSRRLPWSECRATGYPPDTPAWLATGLMIVADNSLHVLINSAALTWLH